MALPSIDPALLADLVAAVPARLKRRLDAEPQLARAWTWASTSEGEQVTTDGGETVHLRGAPVVSLDQLRCTCLLAPRCLHVLAVATLCELAESAPPASDGPPVAASATTVEVVALTPEQVAAAQALWRAAADTLAVGAEGAGVVVHGQWLRAIHQARSLGLHRPAHDAMTALRQLRAVRTGDAAFSPSELCAAWQAVLAAGRAARAGLLATAAIGVARQSYTASTGGPVRLHGLFCEPLWLRGLGGCATWLCDDRGGVWCVRDVRPTDANNDSHRRSQQVAEAGIGWGGATLCHRELGRGGLFVQGFAASANGRLGGERGVQAVGASGTAWTAPPISALFDQPLSVQLQRARQAQTERESDALLFVRAAVLAADGDGLVLAPRDEARPLRAWLTPGAFGSPLRDNLLQLAKTAGVELSWIGRWTPQRPMGFEPLAVGGAALALPSEWAGRANLGYDRLQGAMMPVATQALVRAQPVTPNAPLSTVQRAWEQVALGGLAVARQNTGAALVRDAQRLERSGMQGAAAVIGSLAVAAGKDVDVAAEAWLAVGVYLAGAGQGGLGLSHGPQARWM